MSKIIRKLPDGEFELMQVLWECEDNHQGCDYISRVELEERIAKIHKMAQTTLLTILTRLAEKGFIEIQKQGRVSVYRSLIKRKEYLSLQSRDFITRLCGGSLSVFAAALCDSGLSEDDIEELRKLLREECNDC